MQYLPVETQIVHYPEREKYVPSSSHSNYHHGQSYVSGSRVGGNYVSSGYTSGNYVSSGSYAGGNTYATGGGAYSSSYQPVTYSTGGYTSSYNGGNDTYVSGTYQTGGIYDSRPGNNYSENYTYTAYWFVSLN